MVEADDEVVVEADDEVAAARVKAEMTEGTRVTVAMAEAVSAVAATARVSLATAKDMEATAAVREWPAAAHTHATRSR